MKRTPQLRSPRCFVLGLLAALPAFAQDTRSSTSRELFQTEEAFAEFNDAAGAVSLLDSNPAAYPNGYAGRARAGWLQMYVQRRVELLGMLDTVPDAGLSAQEIRAVKLIRTAVTESSAAPESLAPVGHCKDAQRTELALEPLQQALYACFAELGNSMKFENGKVTRVAAFDLLTRIPEAPRREALFRSFVPLWQALNGADEATSPYRRMIHLAGAETKTKESPIVAAARTVGVSTLETERWLERILDTWRQVSDPTPVEPWNFRFQNGAADRELNAAIPREKLQPLSQTYYADLGFDLAKANVIYDLEPRNGKAPLAYTDYVRRGRLLNGAWQPTVVRVSASYATGGLGSLNELVHENGHAVHMMALHTRPAFMDLGDAIFYEAFADVPAWSVYEPDWQQKYLGKNVAATDSLRALYSGVILDAAWALFDLRMLHLADADPNAVWTDITSRYLHIKPHPELSWWAVRVQLVDKPGYMVNYGLGAVITADLRHRIGQQLGQFQAGDTRWYDWLVRNLLASGEEKETSRLLRQFLGRPVSANSLLAELHRMAPPPTPRTPPPH